MGIRRRINEFFLKELWGIDLSSLDRYRAFLIKSLRVIYVAAGEFSEGQLTLRAMGLAYYTLLAIVPLLAVSFSVLKAFGVHNQIEPFLFNFLLPLGPKGGEITSKIIGFVENMKVGVFGSVGLAILIYTVVDLIRDIEGAFNYIWKIKRPRGFLQRFSYYMSVILIGPVLSFTALGLTATVMSTTLVRKIAAIEPFGTAFFVAGKAVPYIFVIAAFTLVYTFIPNVKVKFKAALVGGLFGGILWETTGWVFASVVVSSTRYAAIYSGFAILIMFMLWLYLSWLILLVGAKVSFYNQYPQFMTVKKEAILLSNRVMEHLSLLIIFLIGYNYYYNKPPWTLNSLVERLGLPMEPVQDVVMLLIKRKLIIETGFTHPVYMPARAIETITLKSIFSTVRGCDDSVSSIEEKFTSTPDVDGVMKRINASLQDALGDDTLKDMVLSHGEDTL